MTVKTQNQCITVMDAYKEKSLEVGFLVSSSNSDYWYWSHIVFERKAPLVYGPMTYVEYCTKKKKLRIGPKKKLDLELATVNLVNVGCREAHIEKLCLAGAVSLIQVFLAISTRTLC